MRELYYLMIKKFTYARKFKNVNHVVYSVNVLRKHSDNIKERMFIKNNNVKHVM